MRIYKCFVLFIVILFAVLIFASCFSADYRENTDESPVPTTQGLEVRPSTAEFGSLNDSAVYLLENGIIKAEDYSADDYVSRLTAVRIISDVTGLNVQAKNSNFTHPFVDLSVEAKEQVSFLYHHNIIDGVTSNTFMENEICSLDTFLVYLIRAIDYVGGRQSDVDVLSAYETAVDRGMIAEDYGRNEDGILSVNDAFDICYDALFVDINDTDTLLEYLSKTGIAKPYNAQDYQQAYEIHSEPIESFFIETFNDKRLLGNEVIDSSGNVVWRGSDLKGTDNSLTQNGYLQMAGYQQELIDDQQFALDKAYLQGRSSYGITFTLNLKRMGNEGNEGRVMFRAIPRTADESFSKYYAVNYYMQLPLGNYQSNLARCKWSITNTNTPSGTAPLAEAYFLLEEDVDYTARLLIENTDDGNVHIAFYIDGPDRCLTDTNPLLEYTDTSKYKIMQSAAGPAFGNSGYKDQYWGYTSIVRVDDIKLYDTEEFNKQTQQLIEYADTSVAMQVNNPLLSQLKYLVNHGVIAPFHQSLDFPSQVSVAQFLATAMYLNGEHITADENFEDFVTSMYADLFDGTPAEQQDDLNRQITRYEAAQIICHMLRGNETSSKYGELYQDELQRDYIDAVYFAVQNSYLLLDEENRFNGDETLNRSDLLQIFAYAVDAGLRDKNYPLQIPGVLTDNAVLQRNKPIPVSGRGMSGDTVTVKFNGQTKTTKVEDGEWYLELDSQPAGGPYKMTISDSGYTRTFKGIYVGEVFVVAGQSNAEWSIYESEDNKDTLRQFNNQRQVRLFRPISLRATKPMLDTQTQWQMAYDEYSEHVFGTTSAIGVFCVQKLLELNPELKGIKIGIVQMTYGGTSIELFMPDCVNEKNNHVQRDNEFIASGFWNGYMDCITPYAVRALMYYQGENSAQLQYYYEEKLREYIWGVRNEFGDEDLPIMLVQLAGYGGNYGQDYDSWPKIREVQMRVANTTDNVGLVTAIDLSDVDPLNIHPISKRPIGERLAYLAMDIVYGQKNDVKSPALTAYELEGNVYRLKFDTESLTIKQDAFGDWAFEILGADGKWTQAQAQVDGNTLLVWSKEVIVPQGVRYAWANYPKACLFGDYDLPVLPFNTTKDLNHVGVSMELTTKSRYLKKTYHLLENNDAIINLTRRNAFRYIEAVNAYFVKCLGEEIQGQSPGDQIALLKNQGSFFCESGTTETIVKRTAHDLAVGDWLRNNKYDVMTRVLEVIDKNTVRVEFVAGQSYGNIFEVFKNVGVITAEE